MLVCVRLSGHHRDPLDPLSELYGLATTAGAIVVGTLTQKRQRPDAGCYVGHGKVEELKARVAELKADVVIFDNELSPGQIRNLELASDTKVLDRTEVILDIFASRARTHEAKLQVELAQLEYALPRLKRLWPHLSRMEGGIGMRGPGEQQLEEDRRIVDRKIVELRRKIQHVQSRKEREVRSRCGEHTVAIAVGERRDFDGDRLLRQGRCRAERRDRGTRQLSQRRQEVVGLGHERGPGFQQAIGSFRTRGERVSGNGENLAPLLGGQTRAEPPTSTPRGGRRRPVAA